MTPTKWRVAAKIFDGAVMLPESDRSDYLKTNCGHDSELHAAVSDLLVADQLPSDGEERSFGLEALGILMEIPAGTTIGSYRIVRKLGAGGMGTVYLADRSDESFEFSVAIKVMNLGVDTRRFHVERGILARLSHPYIASLIDAGALPDGRSYVVMEYVEGQTILEYARTARLDIHQKVRLFQKLCEAVEHAHQNLILHSDLKPGNILVKRDGLPKLLDFGIARQLSQSDALNAAPITTRFFTPGYASPEQQRGSSVTTATDIYSLGIVLLELLCCKQLTQDQKANAEKTSRAFGLPRDLGEIIRTCTREDPKERFQTVGSLSHELDNFIQRKPLQIYKTALFRRAALFLFRNPVLSAGIAISGAVIAIFSLLLWNSRASLAQQLLEVQIAQAKSDAVLQTILNAFDAANPNKSSLSDLSAADVVASVLAESNDLRRIYPDAYAAVQVRVAQIFNAVGDYRASYGILSGIRQLPIIKDDIPAYASVVQELVISLLNLGMLAEAGRAIQDAERVLGRRDPQQVLLYAALDERSSRLSMAKDRYQKLLDHEDVDQVVRREASLGLARVLSVLGESGSVDMFAELYSEIDRSGEINSAFGARTVSAYARAARLDGELLLARKLYEQARDIAAAVYGQSSHPLVGELDNGLGSVLYRSGEFEAAAELYAKSVQSAIHWYGQEHPAVAQRRFNYALALRQIPDRASSAINELANAIRSLGDDHAIGMSSAYFSLVLGEMLLSDGRCSDAREKFLRSESIYSQLEENAVVRREKSEVREYLDQLEGAGCEEA